MKTFLIKIINLLMYQKQMMVEKANLDNQMLQQNGFYDQPYMFYDHLLQQWINDIRKYLKAEFQISPLSRQYFQRVFLFRVQRRFKLRIDYDIQMAHSIIKLSQNPQYQRFNFSEPEMNLNTLQEGEKWIFLFKIAKILYQCKFISKSKFYQVSFVYSQDNSIEKRLVVYLQSMEKQNGKKFLVSTNKWNEIVKISCRQFWTKKILFWPFVNKNKIIKHLFIKMQNFLSSKLSEQQCKQVRKVLDLEFKPKKSKLQSQYLEQLANELDLFSDVAKIQAINSQFQNFKNYIKNQIFPQKSNDEVKFETYGSFRSKICLPNSDIDLTILLYNNRHKPNTERQFIQKSLWKLSKHLRNCLQNKNELMLDKIHPIITKNIKVPFIKVFFKQMPINKMDIVINNEHGVANSQMIQKFAQNRNIRLFLLLVKKWGKKNELISETKLSSFGLSLMALYFLMILGYLQFINPQQLKIFSFNNQLKLKNCTLLELLQKFFSFYSKNSQFYQKQVVCLVKGCKTHENILRPDFIINMHDPYEGTNPNPGRMKDKDSFKFYQSFDDSKSQIHNIKKLKSHERKEMLRKFFGIQKKKQVIIID